MKLTELKKFSKKRFKKGQKYEINKATHYTNHIT